LYPSSTNIRIQSLRFASIHIQCINNQIQPVSNSWFHPQHSYLSFNNIWMYLFLIWIQHLTFVSNPSLTFVFRLDQQSNSTCIKFILQNNIRYCIHPVSSFKYIFSNIGHHLLANVSILNIYIQIGLTIKSILYQINNHNIRIYLVLPFEFIFRNIWIHPLAYVSIININIQIGSTINNNI